MAPNKTDANGADGLAHLAEVGFYREVRVKGYDSMLTRTLVVARTRLVRIATELSNQIRGLMKTFGLVVPKGGGLVFETNVRNPLGNNTVLERIILPLLIAMIVHSLHDVEATDHFVDWGNGRYQRKQNRMIDWSSGRALKIATLRNS